MSEIERFSFLVHEQDQTNHYMCAVVWTDIEGQEWSLHALAKQVIEAQFPKAAEAVANCIAKYGNFNNCQSLHSVKLLKERATLYCEKNTSTRMRIKNQGMK